MSPKRTGENAPGIAILARMAWLSKPPWNTYSVLSTILVATQAKGIGSRLKSMESV